MLEPMIVILSGAAGTGKTTAVEELVKEVPNAFYMEKDSIDRGILHVNTSFQTSELPPFEEYVAGDSVFPDNARVVETPFGDMTQIDPKCAYHVRHARNQTYLVETNLAAVNLRLGKIPIIDCIVPRQIQDGTLRKFLDQPAFSPFPSYLIHFTLNPEDHFERLSKRIQQDPEALMRNKAMLESPEAFQRSLGTNQELMPEALSNYDHLLVNSSTNTPGESAQKILDYISS